MIMRSTSFAAVLVASCMMSGFGVTNPRVESATLGDLRAAGVTVAVHVRKYEF